MTKKQIAAGFNKLDKAIQGFVDQGNGMTPVRLNANEILILIKTIKDLKNVK